MTYRVGLVGTGGIARAHGNACQQIAEADLAAIYDVSEEQLARFGEEYGVPEMARYTDLDQMLNEADLDIISICTWGCFHPCGVGVLEQRCTGCPCGGNLLCGCSRCGIGHSKGH